MSKSYLEGILLEQIRDAGLPEPVREYKFDDTGKKGWLLDFAYPLLKIGIEVEGGVYSSKASRHTFGSTFELDCIKYAKAAIQGWLVIRLGNNLIDGSLKVGVKKGVAQRVTRMGIDLVVEAYNARKNMSSLVITKVRLVEDESSGSGWKLYLNAGEGCDATIGEIVLWDMMTKQNATIVSLTERVRGFQAVSAVKKVALKIEKMDANEVDEQ